jgi:hypothetical protein
MIQWEYKVVILQPGQNEIDTLNAEGQEGWMVWQSDRCPIDGEVVFHLMRPMRAEEKPGES